MLKNLLIIVLLITNGVTLFYIYDHMDPAKCEEVKKPVVKPKPSFYYRFLLADGGVAEGDRFKKKPDSVEIIEDGRVIMSFNTANIMMVEKVYYKSGKSEPVDMSSEAGRQ